MFVPGGRAIDTILLLCNAKISGYNEARALGNAAAGLVATVAATGAGTGIGRCVMMGKHRDLMCHTPP